ncbi:peptidase family M28 [Lentimicrobium saccharophilum]|uniref:Carboxypeptidase Q n=1 Tax=Lentimicrobium saccharophilum TaxID=1678841 RepID=A0A0S7BS68_9BACT|nr:M28 family peptidase [Lentimicrobium saccharophilum]GAP43484.1 peptidase family M28 [Lentimicrobium saccharophilum]
MKRISLLPLVLLTLVFCDHVRAQHNAVVDRIIAEGKTNNKTMQHLDILCNRFGGRLVGSDAYENAAEWAASRFREWGMQVEMDEAGSVPVGFNRGPWFGRMMGEQSMTLHFVTPSYTSGTKGVQTGHVLLEPKTPEEFERMKGALNGAWVLITGRSNGFPIDFSAEADARRDSMIQENVEIRKQIREISRENEKSESKKQLPELKDEPALFYREMREAGILGIIQSAPVPLVALYDRKNINSMTFENLPTVPDIKLDEHQFAVIEQMVKERRTVLLEFDIRNHFKPGPVKYHNVIGIIPGTQYPEEYVIMGGHLDAYDVATGGVDDGSGVSPTMEAARLIMKAGGKPKRTILVCLWAAEEFGLLGSQSWVDRNREKLPYISNMFNRDSGPLAPVSISVSEAMWSEMEKVCAPVTDINPDFPFEMKKRDPSARPLKPWGTDSGPFAVEGVPVMSFGLEDVKGYNFNYREIWHTERDTYNKSIPEYQEHAAVVTAVVVYGIADLKRLLPREGYFTE